MSIGRNEGGWTRVAGVRAGVEVGDAPLALVFNSSLANPVMVMSMLELESGAAKPPTSPKQTDFDLRYSPALANSLSSRVACVRAPFVSLEYWCIANPDIRPSTSIYYDLS